MLFLTEKLMKFTFGGAAPGGGGGGRAGTNPLRVGPPPEGVPWGHKNRGQKKFHNSFNFFAVFGRTQKGRRGAKKETRN